MKKKCMILLGLVIGKQHLCPNLDMVSGDYEIWLGNQMNNRRTERGAFFPPFGKQTVIM